MRVIGCPRNMTWPAVGDRKPANSDSMVDLPQPEAPNRHRNSPSITSSERSWIATNGSPLSPSKVFVTCRAERIAAMPMLRPSAAFPRQQKAFDPRHQPVRDQNGQGNAQHADQDERQIAPILGLPDQRAKTVLLPWE